MFLGVSWVPYRQGMELELTVLPRQRCLIKNRVSVSYAPF